MRRDLEKRSFEFKGTVGVVVVMVVVVVREEVWQVLQLKRERDGEDGFVLLIADEAEEEKEQGQCLGWWFWWFMGRSRPLLLLWRRAGDKRRGLSVDSHERYMAEASVPRPKKRKTRRPQARLTQRSGMR